MPRARPDTTTTPASASSQPNRAAVARPAWVAFRVPTMPTRRASSTPRSPRTKSTAGHAGSAASCGGIDGCDDAKTSTPAATDASQQARGSRRRAEARHRSANETSRVERRRNGRRRAMRACGHAEGLGCRTPPDEMSETADRHVVEPGECSEIPRLGHVGAHAACPIGSTLVNAERIPSARCTDSSSITSSTSLRRSAIDRADPADAVVAAGAQAAVLEFVAQHGTARLADRGELIQIDARQRSVEATLSIDRRALGLPRRARRRPLSIRLVDGRAVRRRRGDAR